MDETELKRSMNARVQPVRLGAGISASNYYLLVAFITALVFFTVLAALYDGIDDLPWAVAGISAIAFAVSFILFREVVMRKSRQREQAARRLSLHLKAAQRFRRSDTASPPKLSLEQISAMVGEIRAKSDAAKLLGKYADAHREVFQLCDEYLTVAAEELQNARAGSPRIPVLRKGAAAASKRHRFHMLRWAEIKAREFSDGAASSTRLSEKIAAADEALEAVETAAYFYPGEADLSGSQKLLQAYLTSARVKAFFEMAEADEAAGNSRSAIGHYKNALAELNRYDVEFAERASVSAKINSEIERIGSAPGSVCGP